MPIMVVFKFLTGFVQSMILLLLEPNQLFHFLVNKGSDITEFLFYLPAWVDKTYIIKF